MSSNERIDHAAEAQNLLAAEASGGTTTERALLLMGVMQAAQAHATLALVEQQRIANKLAVALVEQVGALAQTQAQPGYPSDPMLPVFEYLTDDEREVLGL